MFSDFKPSLRESSPLLIIVMRLIDSAVATALLYPLVLLYTGGWNESYETLVIFSFFLSLIIFHSSGLYQPWRGQNYSVQFRVILLAWGKMVCLILFFLFAFKVADRYSRVVLMAWFFLTPVVLFLVHSLMRKSLRILRASGRNQRNAVIVGAGKLGVSFAKYIEKIPWAGIRVQGFFDDRQEPIRQDGQHPPSNILGAISELKEYLLKNDVDYVYIALPMRAEKKIFEILNSCRTLGARIFLVPDLYAFGFLNSRLQNLGDVLVLDFNPDSSRKRIFDVLFSSVVILICLPLFIIIAILIKLQDNGPIFYGHRRITAAGREFLCLKFRSMHVDADSKLSEILQNDVAAREEFELTFKLKKDPRVTFIGRFLRKTSLDELPQFINVLKGEMSVVGARPIVSRELADYYKENGGIYCSIKPGITGMWQVSKRSDTEEYQERVKLDTWYALNHTFWLDLKIICSTVVCMIKGNGAY